MWKNFLTAVQKPCITPIKPLKTKEKKRREYSTPCENFVYNSNPWRVINTMNSVIYFSFYSY